MIAQEMFEYQNMTKEEKVMAEAIDLINLDYVRELRKLRRDMYLNLIRKL